MGRALGKHKMAPVLSPKKSIEGLIGGIVGAGVFGAVFGILFDKYVDTMNYAPLLLQLSALSVHFRRLLEIWQHLR